MTLVEIQPLIDICSLTLQTAFLADEANAVSLLFIGSPETGKTSTVFLFKKLDFVHYYDEVTQKKIMDLFMPDVIAGRAKFLLIPDLINCIEKQKSTRNQFLSILKSATDDTGVHNVQTFHKSIDSKGEGIKFGLITAITTENFKQISKYLRDTGLLSRFLPFSFSYPAAKIRKIFDAIEGVAVLNHVNIPTIQKTKRTVTISTELMREMEMVATSMGQQYAGYGIRALITLQRLAKASAAIEKRTVVEQKDIDRILQLANWFNFKYNPL